MRSCCNIDPWGNGGSMERELGWRKSHARLRLRLRLRVRLHLNLRHGVRGVVYSSVVQWGGVVRCGEVGCMAWRGVWDWVGVAGVMW